MSFFRWLSSSSRAAAAAHSSWNTSAAVCGGVSIAVATHNQATSKQASNKECWESLQGMAAHVTVSKTLTAQVPQELGKHHILLLWVKRHILQSANFSFDVFCAVLLLSTLEPSGWSRDRNQQVRGSLRHLRAKGSGRDSLSCVSMAGGDGPAEVG